MVLCPRSTTLQRISSDTVVGGFYDFTSDLSSKDTAYTSESLEPHTDTTYFTDPIVGSPIPSVLTMITSTNPMKGLQALHLLSHTDGSGGLSSLVDGFNMAARLKQEDPAAYKILSMTRLFAHASGNEGVSIQPAQSFPVLNHYDPERMFHLQQIRWNTADRAGIDATMGPSVESWYDAAA
jgi:trimethyllysine dioxygenase